MKKKAPQWIQSYWLIITFWYLSIVAIFRIFVRPLKVRLSQRISPRSIFEKTHTIAVNNGLSDKDAAGVADEAVELAFIGIGRITLSPTECKAYTRRLLLNALWMAGYSFEDAKEIAEKKIPR